MLVVNLSNCESCSDCNLCVVEPTPKGSHFVCVGLDHKEIPDTKQKLSDCPIVGEYVDVKPSDLMYQERKEIRKQMSQMLADAGLNQGTIQQMVVEEIQRKVDRAVDIALKRLDAQSSPSGNFLADKADRLLRGTIEDKWALKNAVREALAEKVVSITLKNVTVEDDGR